MTLDLDAVMARYEATTNEWRTMDGKVSETPTQVYAAAAADIPALVAEVRRLRECNKMGVSMTGGLGL